MAGFFCCYCGADETNPCDCFSKKDEQVSESTGPKTWGDVISGNEMYGYNAKSRCKRVNYSVSVAGLIADISRRGQETTEIVNHLEPGDAKVVLRWLLADRPPLTDPIPPETPEPVAKVVRWEPTKEDAERFEVDLATWESAFDDRRIFREVFSDTIRDCQRDLPEVEPTTPPTDRIADIESRLAALESRAILKPDYDPRDVALMPSTATVDGWQTKPPAVDCPCWVETTEGEVVAVLWSVISSHGYDYDGAYWYPGEISRYHPSPKPPAHIGKATYNTPTSFEQALTVEPPAAPEPEIPLPDGCTAIEGFPLLCMDENNNAWTRRQRRYVLPWVEDEIENMKSHDYSDAEIKQSARYAIEQIARDAGLNVTVK